jgi:hypothetical protein
MLVLPSAVLAQTAEIDALREQVRSRRWAQAVRGAEEYLARDDLTAAVRNGVLELLADAQLGAGDAGAAEAILATVLARDPEHRLSAHASPALRGAFERARAARPSTVRVELRHETPGVLDAQGVARLRVELAGAHNAVDRVEAFFSAGNRDDYQSTPMQIGGIGATMQLPPDEAARTYGVRYYFEARAPSGAVLARLGTAERPMWLTAPGGTGSAPPVEPPADEAPAPPVESDDDGGVLTEWWFWTLLGLVVAGGAVGAYFLFGPPSQEIPDGTLGNVELLRFP